MKHMRKALCMLLALIMVIGLLPMAALAVDEDESAVAVEAAEAETTAVELDEAAVEVETYDAVTMDTITKNKSVPLDTSKFYTIFHLDCGRNYFSVQQIKNIIDEMAKDGYNTLELAIGNDGLRFLLDDMSVTANGKTYDSTTVANALKSGNSSYRNNGTNQLTQSEMDEIIAYANSKNIAIIPLVNAPGHANTMLAIMKAVGISNPAYNNDPRTIDVRNAEAVNFALALVNKYIQYFADKGCKIFNMGADEYANTSYSNGSMGFGHLQSAGEYGYYADFVNNMAAQIQNAGMTAMAFNDGIYFNSKTSATFDSDIAIAYWSGGFGSYTPASAAFLADKGHKIINTNDGWYYVVGRDSDGYSYSSALNAAKNTKVTDIPNPVNAPSNYKDPTAYGAMFCLWYDKSATYEESKVLTLLSTLAENNASYFVVTPVTPPAEAEDKSITAENGVSVTAPGLTGLKVTEVASPAYQAKDGEQVKGYNITPAGYTQGDKATVSVPVPAGWENLAISVYDVKESKIISSKVENNTVVFETAHFSEFDLLAANADIKNVVNVELFVGDTSVTYTEESGAYNSGIGLDTTIATAAITPNTILGEVTSNKESSVVSGQQYLLYNQRAKKTVTNEPYSDGLKLDGTDTDIHENAIWTITATSGGYYVQDENSKYLSIGNGTVALSTEPVVLQLAYADGSWQIGKTLTNVIHGYDNGTTITLSEDNVDIYGNNGYYYKDGDSYYLVTKITRTRTSSWTNTEADYTIYYNNKSAVLHGSLFNRAKVTLYKKIDSSTSVTYYLNDYDQKSTHAFGYTQYDDGSKWDIYSVTSTEDVNKTTVQFTGVTSGTTSVVIGETQYNVTVKRQGESASIKVADTKTYSDASASSYKIADPSVVSVAVNGNSLTITGLKPGTTTVTTDRYVYTITVERNARTEYVLRGETFTIIDSTASSDQIIDHPEYANVSIEGDVITITGVSVGTTTFSTDACDYTIIVFTESLTGVSNKTIEFWATNRKVAANSKTSVSVTASQAHSRDGIKVSDIVPTEGKLYQDSSQAKYGYWKATALDTPDHQQTTAANDDETKNGDDFQFIRYYNGSWAYSADGVNWINIGKNTTSTQLVAYYLQVTSVTDEVTTDVVDWGVVPHTGYDNSDFVLVDFSVKYESGDELPNSFPVTGKTMGFHCESGNATVGTANGVNYRYIGMILGEQSESADYEIYLITVTPTSDDASVGVAANCNIATKYSYDGTEAVAWAATQDDLDNSGMPQYSSISNTYHCQIGGDAMVEALEIYNRHGMKVTYYVRAKVTDDALTVKYVDKTTGTEFYNYGLVVSKGTLFKSNIDLNNSGAVVNGDVVNSLGKTQTVSSDLATMPSIPAAYRYSSFKADSLERSEDGKTVTIYYVFNNTHEFVMDFGLPLTITTADLGISGNWTSATVSGAKYGEAAATVGQGVTYTPTSVLQGVEQLNLVLTGSEGSATHIIYIYPATTVYYEEGFASYTGSWGGNASKGSAMQATTPASVEKRTSAAVYGFDTKYAAESTGASNGTEAVSGAKKDRADFVFTGTGVDVFANCTTDTDYATVQIKNSAGAIKGLYIVNTTTTGSLYTEAASYGLPIVSLIGLPRDTYTVSVAQTREASIRIDGFRVYGTIDENNAVYVNDLEDNPTYVELRSEVLNAISVADGIDVYEQVNALLKDEAASVTAIVVDEGADSFNKVSADELLKNGPKNELFLKAGQSVVFNVDTNKQVQVGLKAVNAAVNATVDGKTMNITSSTDMFYSISANKAVTITNNGDGVLSITKIKVCDDPSAALVPLTENDVDAILENLGLLTKGDADESGNVTLADVAKAYSLAIKGGVSDYLMKVLDMNGDGKLNLVDVSLIYAKYTGR